MKNIVQEFSEIVIKAKTEIEHLHKFLLIFSIYVLACLLAAKNVFVAFVVDVVVSVAAFHVRVVIISPERRASLTLRSEDTTTPIVIAFPRLLIVIVWAFAAKVSHLL